MAERYRTPRKDEDTKKNDPNACSDHAKELGAFCGTCRELVCIDCIVGDHKGHPIESVEDVYYKRTVIPEPCIILSLRTVDSRYLELAYLE